MTDVVKLPPFYEIIAVHFLTLPCPVFVYPAFIPPDVPGVSFLSYGIQWGVPVLVEGGSAVPPGRVQWTWYTYDNKFYTYDGGVLVGTDHVQGDWKQNVYSDGWLAPPNGYPDVENIFIGEVSAGSGNLIYNPGTYQDTGSGSGITYINSPTGAALESSQAITNAARQAAADAAYAGVLATAKSSYNNDLDIAWAAYEAANKVNGNWTCGDPSTKPPYV